MGVEVDVASLNPDFLLHPELPPLPPLSSNRFLAEEVFSLWLSLPETVRLVKSFLEDPDEISTVISVSTKEYPQLKQPSIPVQEVIPQFYFENCRPELKELCLASIDVHFDGRTGLRIGEFKAVTKDLCGLPSFFSTTLFRKIDVNNTGLVTRDQFVDYWIGGNMLSMDLATRIYRVLKQPGLAYLTKDNFRPFLDELVESHPWLEFIRKEPGNRGLYVRTVLCTIFYYINRSNTGHLTLRELKRGNLISAMQQVDEEKDINKVLKYFSYEHFYVIWFKFCELDTTNQDLLIVKEDLLRYGEDALCSRIVDRIFDQVPRKFNCKIKGNMDYEDFVYFILSEEDKSSEPAVEYWFKCLDLDGNGVLTPNELKYFFEEQSIRFLYRMGKYVVFEDIFDGIIDMIRPKNENYISLSDLKGSTLSAHFFNTLFNLDKYVAFDKRDLVSNRPLHSQELTWTDWERFAHTEYLLLCVDNGRSRSSILNVVKYGPDRS